MAVSSPAESGPAQADLDKCVHCGLCLNACPTYRELGVEMDSPRGRIYQMNAVANGAPITPEYIQHMDCCLACRGCETACPSGVPYGRMIEAARAGIAATQPRSRLRAWTQNFLLNRVIPSPSLLAVAATGTYLYQRSGIQRAVRASGVLRLSRHLADLESLTPEIRAPFFFRSIGRTFPALGVQRHRVALVAGCIANVAFAELNAATVRVLQRNGCRVTVPAAQTCCGALHLHSGLRQSAEQLARRNIDAFLETEYDAILTNAAGCGSTLKEYDTVLADDPAYAARARTFVSRMRDVTEFLASLPLNLNLAPVPQVATYQDSCHLSHGQKIRSAPRVLLRSIPELNVREMPQADTSCGSAGTYNITQTRMAMQILEHKMEAIATTEATLVLTANPGCLLQLRTGARRFGRNQRVLHVVELLDESYRAHDIAASATTNDAL